ncbi:hypothetical protein HDU79_008470 [Rhizoclosmatium sp. JEL0117]|nr:hypothetical protein HDU79_008470 [Rhizoclosmatium sp. JEL0117]
MMGYAALEQLCRQYELKRSLEFNKIKLDSAKTNVALAVGATKGLVLPKSKTNAAIDLAAATSHQDNLETVISNSERELAKLENVFSNHKEDQIDFFVTLTKLMVLANDLDEIVYSRVLGKSVANMNDATQILHNAYRALYEITHALTLPVAIHSDYADHLSLVSRQLLSNATMWYPPLARFRSFSTHKKASIVDPHWQPEQVPNTMKRVHEV